MRNGPRRLHTARKTSANDSRVSTRAASTPMPFARWTQIELGSCEIEQLVGRDTGPGAHREQLAVEDLVDSVGEDDADDVEVSRAPGSTGPGACTSPPRLPADTRPCGPDRRAPPRSRRETPARWLPPVIWIQSCGAALKVGARSARPDVTASSETMQFSGSSAARVVANAIGSNGPLCNSGSTSPTGISTLAGAPSSSARAVQGRNRIFLRPGEHVSLGVRTAQSRLGFPGYPKNPVGGFAPASTTWRTPSSSLIARSTA